MRTVKVFIFWSLSPTKSGISYREKLMWRILLFPQSIFTCRTYFQNGNDYRIKHHIYSRKDNFQWDIYQKVVPIKCQHQF